MGFLDTAIVRARALAGQLSEVELPTAKVRQDLVLQVGDEFSNLVPRRAVHQLALSPNVSSYALPNDRISGIVAYGRPHSGSDLSGLVGDGYSVPSTVSGYRSYYIGAVALDLVDNDNLYVHVDDGRLIVEPTPTQGGTLHIIAAEMWDFGTDLTPTDATFNLIPRPQQQVFVYLLASSMARCAAERRALLPQIRVGASSTSVGFNEMIKLSMELAQKAKSLVGPTPFAVH